MSDREKVIKELEECLTASCRGFWTCPYSDNAWDAVREALALLREHEPIAPVKVNRYIETNEHGGWFPSETYDCGNCGAELCNKANYCYVCGRPVKWDVSAWRMAIYTETR